MTIGSPLPRADGRIKVTGRARYAADQPLEGLLHAALVGAPIPAGRIAGIDSRAALAVPGVLRVLTAADLPRFAAAPSPPLATRLLPLQDDSIHHEGEAVAIVLAESLEAAEQAARLVRVSCVAAPFVAAGAGPAVPPAADSGYVFEALEFRKGDAEAGLAAAALVQEAAYIQPSRHHNPMEPSATLAVWEDDGITLYDSVQHGYGVQFVVAAVFGLEPARVRVVSPHTGGGFGCKGYVWPHEILAVAAARVAGRPVKLVLTRAQMYAMVGYQPQMEQSVALGSDGAGRLTAVTHRSVNLTSPAEDFVEFATQASKALYATPAIATQQLVQHAQVNMPTAMRAPVEGPGTWALESAMNELAARLSLDPLELRLANYAEVDPADGKPWSSKKLREAYAEGAALFGWQEARKAVRQDGDWLLGVGMATCSMGCFRFPSKARVRLLAEGSAVVEAGFHDIGTGTLTIFPQIAAEVLGLEASAVGTRMGDTLLAQAGPTYGSSSTMGVGAAVLRAAEAVRDTLARLANLPPAEAEVRNGLIGRRGSSEGVAVTALLREAGIGEIVGDGSFALPGDAAFEVDGKSTPYAMRTFGAIFVEVAVDPLLGLLRLRRAVGSYSAGRIVNPRTARAQMTGGIIWGWGMAALEESRYEPALGRWLSKNLSGVAIPVNADIPPDIQVHFVDEVDPYASPIGGKGIGELGATGVAAAVADAVFHATGKRFRELPITPAKLLMA